MGDHRALEAETWADAESLDGRVLFAVPKKGMSLIKNMMTYLVIVLRPIVRQMHGTARR
jgi:hypothetical protein